MNGEQAGAGKPDVPVIVFCNHKGGVAKTTTTVMVAEIFYREFNVPRILVIDCDSQGNASESLSQEDITNIPTIESCIGDPENAKHCISPSFIDGVDIIAANTRLESPIPADIGLGSGIESIPVAYKTSLGAIDEIIKRVKDNYDIILIDTAPNISPITQSAIYAATCVVIPCSPIKHALFGMPVMSRTVLRVNPTAPVLVVTTIHDRRTSYENIAIKHLHKGFNVIGDIPRNSRLSENISKHYYVLNRMEEGRKEPLLSFCKTLLNICRGDYYEKISQNLLPEESKEEDKEVSLVGGDEK